jgi:hypothetical protein
MAAPKNPFDVGRINIDDPAESQAFYEALIAHGARLDGEERMQAFRAGLIDEQGRVVDHSRVTDVDTKLSLEQ